MTTSRRFLLPILGAAVFAAALAVSPVAEAARIYVSVAPPAPIVEVRPAVPGPGYVWVDGYHRWDGHAYVWVPGAWRVPPKHHYRAWVPGHWSHHHTHGYYWVEGHWRR